ncbi:hypothetical protein G6F68_016692 [Rhizopus microsporus]|nr:hypothetical protein G6F68_016692 [Rhizopus microsporus]
MQLPFAIIPLVRIVTDKVTMGALVAPRWLGSIAWVIALVIVVLNPLQSAAAIGIQAGAVVRLRHGTATAAASAAAPVP